MKNLLVLCFILSSTAPALAKRAQCTELFVRGYSVEAFYIPLATKKQSKKFFKLAAERVTERASFDEIMELVALIASPTARELTIAQKDLILNFRQDTSFLRTAFQLNREKHDSPNKFGNFVRDFGKMKDALLINDRQIASRLAQDISDKYIDMDIYAQLDKVSYSGKKSTQKYLKKQIKTIRSLAVRKNIVVDEFHDIRKAVREILRYLQLHQELAQSTQNKADAALANAVKLTDPDQTMAEQIKFLKKFNQQLGEICDENAGLILQARLTKHSQVEFPQKLREKAIYLTEKVIFEDEGAND